MKENKLESWKSFYFIGIGGVSMSALAKFLRTIGKAVAGYDAVYSERVEELKEWSVPVAIGEVASDEALALSDVVVYSDAISPENPLRAQAVVLQKTVLSRAEFLCVLCECFQTVVAIAGSHGKTTCTAMCSHILKATGVPFTAHIGGEDTDFSNFYSCGRSYFVTEACEYKKNHLKFRADRAVLLNVDLDHMECYQNEADLVSSFETYCERAQAAFVCADDERCMRFGRSYTTFGIENPHCDYRAVSIRQSEQRYSFTVLEYGKPLCRVRLSVLGRHNIYNALAAFAVTRSLGFNEQEIANGLASFKGVKRRFERIGELAGVPVICDYAHHPREIFSTVETAKRLCKGRLHVVFQPHTYSRTRLLMKEFVSVLRTIDDLVVFKTYPARERYDEAGSGKRLADCVGGCLYAETVKELKAWISASVLNGDALLFLGAGDVTTWRGCL